MNDRDIQLCPPLEPNQSATQEECEDTTNLQIIDCPPFHKLVPPLNFCPVEKDLYRSGQPSPINFAFLDTLKLKTIVWLAVEDPTEAFLSFADTSDITIHHLGLPEDNSHSWDQLTEYTIRQALDIIVNKQNHPCLVCCGMGRHRTGAVIGCLRRLEKWNLSSVSEEYRRFAGSRGRVLIELLIEAFDTKSIRVDHDAAPSWLLE